MVLASISGSVDRGFTVFFAWVPALIGAIVVLLIGYIVARVVSKLVARGSQGPGSIGHCTRARVEAWW